MFLTNTHKKHAHLLMAGCMALCLSAGAEAKSFKAKYYKECYADVKKVAKLVTPKESLSKKAGKLGGLFATVGSFAGIGGAGGTAAKAANAAQKINKYSSIIDNAAAFQNQMITDHPEPEDRFAAVGSRMSTEASEMDRVLLAVEQSQTCYQSAHQTLMKEVQEGKIKKRKAKKRMKEINNGVVASGDVLLLAAKRLNTNINSYNQMLDYETRYVRSDLIAAQQATKVTHLTGSGFASMAVFAGLNNTSSQPDSTVMAGNQGTLTLARSSEEYLALHQKLQQTVQRQRQLEDLVRGGL